MVYLLLAVAFVALIQWIGPPGALTDDGWRLRTDQELDLGRGASLAFILVLLGPQMVAAVAYARLFTKVHDRTQRYRIAMLTGSILVWFGTSAAVGATSDPQEVNVAWQVMSRLLSIAAALAILAAYRPPRWVQRRYAIRSLDNETMPTGSAPEAAA